MLRYSRAKTVVVSALVMAVSVGVMANPSFTITPSGGGVGLGGELVLAVHGSTGDNPDGGARGGVVTIVFYPAVFQAGLPDEDPLLNKIVRHPASPFTFGPGAGVDNTLGIIQVPLLEPTFTRVQYDGPLFTFALRAVGMTPAAGVVLDPSPGRTVWSPRQDFAGYVLSGGTYSVGAATPTETPTEATPSPTPTPTPAPDPSAILDYLLGRTDQAVDSNLDGAADVADLLAVLLPAS